MPIKVFYKVVAVKVSYIGYYKYYKLLAKVNNLTKYFKIPAVAALWIASLVIASSNVYSFDYYGLDLSLTKFLNSLSYNYRGFDIKVKGVAIGETYDDNVTFSSDDKEEDFITNMGVGIGVDYEGKRNSFGFIANIYNETYARNNTFNNIAQDLTLNFKSEFSKYSRINLQNVFSHSDAPLFFTGEFFTEQFGRPSGRFDYFQNTFSIDYENDIARQITTTARYTNNIDAFSGINLPASFQNAAGFGVKYLLSSATNLLWSYDFIYRQFDNGGDATIHIITTGVRQYITKKFYFDGAAGLDFIDSFDNENFVKPVFQASLTHELDENSDAKLSFTKQSSTSPYFKDIFNHWQTSLSFNRQVLKRLGCSLSLFYGEGEYITSNLEQNFWGARSIFTYDINDNLKWNFTYTYSQADANFEGAEYTKNTVFLGLTAEF